MSHLNARLCSHRDVWFIFSRQQVIGVFERIFYSQSCFMAGDDMFIVSFNCFISTIRISFADRQSIHWKCLGIFSRKHVLLTAEPWFLIGFVFLHFISDHFLSTWYMLPTSYSANGNFAMLVPNYNGPQLNSQRKEYIQFRILWSRDAIGSYVFTPGVRHCIRPPNNFDAFVCRSCVNRSCLLSCRISLRCALGTRARCTIGIRFCSYYDYASRLCVAFYLYISESTGKTFFVFKLNIV